MKEKSLLLWLFLCCLFSTTIQGQNFIVTQRDALEAAQREFQGKDVDYYLMGKSSTLSVWTIFVDAEPMKGWEHDCYVLSIPKTTSGPMSDLKVTQKIRYKLPPAGEFVPLAVKNRYGSNAEAKPIVAKSNAANPVATRTYALILSGGVNKLCNNERYWNDCSFIYKTLVNRYGIPKSNIYPLMADGNDPAEDMLTVTGGFKSQPLDLDGDNVADIKLAATKTNISSTLNTLKSKISKDDHLFIFVIDHGGTDDFKTTSYINLWGNEKLYDYDLADMLTPFCQKYANVNVVLGQCYSGGFKDNLTKIGCVVAAASAGNEPSWSCYDIPYDEFVYHWTCAVNGADHKMNKVDADTDSNGKVTMEEAFAYAKSHDRVKAETPQYVSTPLSVGEDLAFTYLAPAIDLYVKAGSADTGKMPDRNDTVFWDSPSIWVRNTLDGGLEHENPVYDPINKRDAFVYVRIYNRGKADYNGETMVASARHWLKIYWGEASTALNSRVWRGYETYENDGRNWVTGGGLEALELNMNIPAGESAIIPVGWLLPQMMAQQPEKKFHFCLLAKILDKSYDVDYKEGEPDYNLIWNNNHAQRNVMVIKKEQTASSVEVYVRNIYSTDENYTLELVPRKNTDAILFQQANIEMSMTPKIYAAWQKGGFKGENILRLTGDTPAVRFLAPGNKLNAVCMKEKDFDIVSLKFNFTNLTLNSRKYTYDLIQRDASGNIVGGETFIIESPSVILYPIQISSVPEDNGDYLLTTNTDEDSHLEWTNANGEIIGEESYVTVHPAINNDTYSVKVLTADGELGTADISLAGEYGLKNITVHSDSEILEIVLMCESPEQANLSLIRLSDGSVITENNIASGQTNFTMECKDLRSGFYTVVYKVNGKVIDQKKISI